MPNLIIPEVDRQNDFRATLGPITGKPADSERRELYHEDDVVAFWASSKGSDTPLGGVTVQCPEVGDTGLYPVVIEQPDMAAALAGLVDGTPVYLIAKAPGDFRRFREYRYAEAIAAP